MTLRERLENDYKAAFKGGDRVSIETLRFLKAQIKNAAIARRRELDDHEALDVIIKDAKSHSDSITQFLKGNRPDLAAKEQEQLKVLEGYLPARLTDDELKDIIRELMVVTGATSQADLGKLMGVIMQKVKGQADGDRVRQLAIETLNTPH